jgi:hypothetical protein
MSRAGIVVAGPAPMKKHLHVWILIFGFVLIAAPYLYYLTPQYFLSPDLIYVKAKALWVMNGHLYADPVTGIKTLHPPYYHLLLAAFMRLGVQIDTLLFWISLINVFLIGLFAYLILRKLFPPDSAAITVLLIPFINRYMGSSYLFLASSFTFSLPIFLAGLWLFLRERTTIGISILTALLWGLAFLISPGYLFLIGLGFLYDIYRRRDFRRVFIMVGTFIITIIPFFYQAYVVLSFYAANSLGRASTFAFWRGLPDLAWIGLLLQKFVAPGDRVFLDWHTFLVIAVLAAATIGYLRSKNRHAFPLIALAAYVLTFYHFSFQYASRVLYIFSIFAVAYAVQWLASQRKYRYPAYAAVALLVLFSTTDQVVRSLDYYAQRAAPYASFKIIESKVHPKLLQYLHPGRFVLASDRGYRNFILPYFPARSLIGARSGEYFQLPDFLAEEMKNNHEVLMTSMSRDTINQLCILYGINDAVSFFDDSSVVFQQLKGWWQEVYADKFLTIYHRPPTVRPPADGGGR